MIWLMVAVVAVLVAVNFLILRGEDLRPYDESNIEIMNADKAPSEGHHTAVALLREMGEAMEGAGRSRQLELMRKNMDALGADVVFEGSIVPFESESIRGEWLLAPGADPDRRLLYIHGGAFMAGSPLSHRAITTEYARRYGGAVFSLDYRLMPEHRRQAGIDDCRAAYHWILENGPEGPAPAREVFISGDSAGGNLTLSLSNYIRDAGLKRPNGVIALSPATDATLSSPSLKTNIPTDHMLGPAFGKLLRIPRFVLGLSAWVNNRMLPRHPVVSPVFADLGGLPPTLVHVSAQEMLLDDAVRYVNKARAQGSPVELQVWGQMLHVWHIFVLSDTDEAAHAFDQILQFMQQHSAAVDEAAA